MVKMVDAQNRSALEFNKAIAPSIHEIAAPLKLIGVEHFSYVRIFNDSKLLRLSGDARWSQKYFENSFYNDSSLYGIEHIPSNELHYRIFTGSPQNEHHSALQEHGFWHIFALYKKKETYCDVWFFCASRENDRIIECYINKIDYFKKFAVYFSNKMHDVVNEHNPNYLTHMNLQKNVSLSPCEECIFNDFQNAIDIKKYRFGANIFLGKREVDCVMRFLRGETTKEIGLHLNLSPRTVESYLESVKKKLNCNTSKLREIFSKGTSSDSVNDLFNFL